MGKKGLNIVLFSVLALLPSLAQAATRIKTIEYTFGARDGASAPADLASNGVWTPSAITVYLPENAKVFRSAWLDAQALMPQRAALYAWVDGRWEKQPTDFLSEQGELCLFRSQAAPAKHWLIGADE